MRLQPLRDIRTEGWFSVPHNAELTSGNKVLEAGEEDIRPRCLWAGRHAYLSDLKSGPGLA